MNEYLQTETRELSVGHVKYTSECETPPDGCPFDKSIDALAQRPMITFTQFKELNIENGLKIDPNPTVDGIPGVHEIYFSSSCVTKAGTNCGKVMVFKIADPIVRLRIRLSSDEKSSD